MTFVFHSSWTFVGKIDLLFKYRKIPKISPGAYIFQRPFFRGAYFWKGLYSEGIIYGGKFVFQNRLG